MSWRRQLLGRAATLGLAALSASAQPVINEILFAPPGPDLPNQYVELRGAPNTALPQGTCLVAVNGNSSGNPGAIENVFDLSGLTFGGNGFLVLLQKGNLYTPSAAATILVNTGTGSGFGNGSSSTIGHRGRNGRTDLPHASVSFLLVLTTNVPNPGLDIDTNNDGVIDGPAAGWTMLDAIGIGDAPSDVAYGLLNFQHDTNAIASGTVVPLSFTPGYFGRAANTVDATPEAWVAAGGLSGSAPGWILTTNRTFPPEFSGRPLDHLGLPNFGADPLPGIVALQTGGSTTIAEGGPPNAYKVGLNTVPAGQVVVEIDAPPPLQVSVDGTNFYSTCAVTLEDSAPRDLFVRSLADNAVEPSPYPTLLRHTLLRTDDPDQYPLGTPGPVVTINVIDQDWLLLNELKPNPPGTNDAPCEYIELKGPPNALLRQVYLLAIDGDASHNPGQLLLALDLNGAVVGTDGLLFVAAPSHPYLPPADTGIVLDSTLSAPGGALKNTAVSFLLVANSSPLAPGSDLDGGDNGIPEGLQQNTRILDSVGWKHNANDIVYGGAVLTESSPSPDALARFETNLSPNDAAAWYFGELAGTACASAVFDSSQVSTNFPFGAVLSPGLPNAVPIQIAPTGPFSGVIGDPMNPGLDFSVSAAGENPDSLVVTASSTNPDVVPDSNLTVVPGAGGRRTLFINPVGVGYAAIILTATGSTGTGQLALPYAASEMGRPGGVWHTFSSDASTALAIDTQYMFVGDNENNTIRLYERDRSGPPVAQFDFQAALGLTPQERGEVNIEGSTRVGNRFFFIGAHSNANSGSSRTNRNRIFAVDFSGSGTNSILSYVGRYDYLKPDLIAWDVSNGHGKGSNYFGFAASAADNVDPKAPTGFNIEGLTMAPGSTNVAWVAFRAPIVPATNRTFALIVPVLNFATLTAGDAPQGSAIFGEPIELDLYGRGIRSIEADTNACLISAGPPADVAGYPNDFRLFTWTGDPAQQPQQRAADLSGIQPEGIAELPAWPWSDQTRVQLITDNGTTLLYGDGAENKHLPVDAFKKFRSDWVTLGPVVNPIPVITSIQPGATNVLLTWRALKGLTYRVQTAQDFADPSWTDLPGDLPATGPFLTALLPQPNRQQTFYRVKILTAPTK